MVRELGMNLEYNGLIASFNPTACKAATQCCGLGWRSLNSTGLNKAGENTPLHAKSQQLLLALI